MFGATNIKEVQKEFVLACPAVFLLLRWLA
jgi:hypothetical protein